MTRPRFSPVPWALAALILATPAVGQEHGAAPPLKRNPDDRLRTKDRFDPGLADLSRGLAPRARQPGIFPFYRFLRFREGLGPDVRLSALAHAEPTRTSVAIPRAGPPGAEVPTPGVEERRFEVKELGNLRSLRLVGRYRELRAFPNPGPDPRGSSELNLRLGYSVSPRLTWVTELSFFDFDLSRSVSDSLHSETHGWNAVTIGFVLSF